MLDNIGRGGGGYRLESPRISGYIIYFYIYTIVIFKILLVSVIDILEELK